ncbi:MAG: hypothetical protein WA688_05265 [Thermoplasmata archaeon]
MSMRFLRVSAGIAVLLIAVLIASTTAASPVATGPTSHFESALLKAAITTKTVTVGKDPNIELYDPDNKDMYVSNEGANTVSAISSTTYAVTSIKVGTDPLLLTYDATSKAVYVENFETSISVISAANKVVKTIKFPSGTIPLGQFYDPGNGDVYALCVSSSGSVAEQINSATYALKSVALPTGALDMAYDNATLSLMVSSGSSNEVTAISSSNVATKISLTAGVFPSFMVFDPHDSDMYIADTGEGTHGFTKTGNVSVLSSSNKIIATIKVGAYPTIPWYDPANFEIYQINTGIPTGTTYPASTVSLIGTANTVVKTLTVGKEAVVAGYDPKNSEMYISCPRSNLTYAITSANAITAKVATKQYATAAEYDPALGDMLAIGFTSFLGASTADTLVTVIPSTNTGTSTVTLGEGPVGGAGYNPTDSGFWVVNTGTTTVTVIL